MRIRQGSINRAGVRTRSWGQDAALPKSCEAEERFIQGSAFRDQEIEMKQNETVMQKGELQCSGMGCLRVRRYICLLSSRDGGKQMLGKQGAWKLDCKLSFAGFAGNGREIKLRTM